MLLTCIGYTGVKFLACDSDSEGIRIMYTILTILVCTCFPITHHAMLHWSFQHGCFGLFNMLYLLLVLVPSPFSSLITPVRVDAVKVCVKSVESHLYLKALHLQINKWHKCMSLDELRICYGSHAWETGGMDPCIFLLQCCSGSWSDVVKRFAGSAVNGPLDCIIVWTCQESLSAFSGSRWRCWFCSSVRILEGQSELVVFLSHVTILRPRAKSKAFPVAQIPAELKPRPPVAHQVSWRNPCGVSRNSVSCLTLLWAHEENRPLTERTVMTQSQSSWLLWTEVTEKDRNTQRS